MRRGAHDTIAAPATPAGESALALLRVSGPLSGALVGDIFRGPPLPRSAVHAAYRDRAGRLVDDVLYTYFAAPHSFTGDDTLEISCHGNPYIVQRLLEDLWARGCRPAEPGEFTQRAFLNGRLDLSQAEAVMDVIHARGERALEAAQRQLRGALGDRTRALIARLLDLVAQVEADLDFPEEDLPPADRVRLQAEGAAIADALARLRATGRYGELLRAGVRTVLVGAPNAGKSSLLNRLLGWERALVDAAPGTTRDFLEEARIAGPYCIRLIDTAGVHAARDALEARGMARTLERAAAADLILLVLDTTCPIPELPAALTERLTAANTVLVWNKVDCAPPRPPPDAWRDWRQVAVSALDGRGLPELEAAIVAAIDAHQLGDDGELVAINARHAHDLGQAQECLEEAQKKLTDGAADELLAADLRGALDALGRIAGKIDHEEMLDIIFSRFCIGK